MSAAIELSTPDWHAARSRNIGGSEVAALFGMQPAYALDAWSLWQVKSGRADPPPVEGDRIAWGNRLEAVIASGLAEDHGWTVRKGGYVIDDTTPGMACSLDYEIVGGEEGRDDVGCLELKNVDWLQHKRGWTDNEPPTHIILQLQHQLACTGRTWGVVGSLIGGNRTEVYRYERRPKVIAEIRKRVTEFWASVDRNEPPPMSGSDAAAAILRAMYSPLIDETVDLTTDNELPEICSGLLGAIEARRTAEKVEAEWKNRLVEKMGPHIRAETNGFWINVAVTAEKPSRPAKPGEVIPGRRESRRYTVKEQQA